MADKPDMVPARSWRDHFRVDQKILQEFWDEFQGSSPLRASELSIQTASRSVEFVLWCVRAGHFSEEAFTRYQSEAYNLPVIRSEFFSSPIDHEFWARVKDLHPWNPACLPLSDWDGHVLIGSVWPEETFKTSLRHRLVLATPSHLRAQYDRFQSKDSGAPFAMPALTITRYEHPAPKAAQKVAHTKEIKFDPADPFAALSRELGLTPDDTAHESPPEALEPNEELVIPEGLSFNREEISRLTNLDLSAPTVSAPTVIDGEQKNSDIQNTDGVELGTVVHDFETGENDVVQKKPNEFATQIEMKPVPANDPIEPMSFELELDLAATESPGIESPAAAVTKAARPQPPPSLVIPFAPIVTPEQPAMVKPPALELTLVPPAPTSPNDQQPKRPIAEATVVVKMEEPIPIATGEVTAPIRTPRRPLFEPNSDTSAAPTGSINITNPGVKQAPRVSSNMTQTGTRGRKLEAPPVTSFFGIGGSAGPSLSKTRDANDHSGRVVAVSRLNPIHLDQCTSVDEAGAQSLLQACNIFETAMILLFKDGELQPWKWNDLLLSVNADRPNAIDLQDPSIFKVVFRTAKPYHGYVVTSTVNQKFFNEFNRGMLPKHVTLIPIMIDGRMGGMLLCLTNSKIDYRHSLRLMERLSYDLARVFKALRRGSAKAS